MSGHVLTFPLIVHDPPWDPHICRVPRAATEAQVSHLFHLTWWPRGASFSYNDPSVLLGGRVVLIVCKYRILLFHSAVNDKQPPPRFSYGELGASRITAVRACQSPHTHMPLPYTHAAAPAPAGQREPCVVVLPRPPHHWTSIYYSFIQQVQSEQLVPNGPELTELTLWAGQEGMVVATMGRQELREERTSSKQGPF